jgi:F-type H+-transporting ATPase subunit b
MLEFEPGLIIWTSVSFGLLVLLLYRIGVPVLIALLQTREKLIADTLAEVADAKKQAEAVLLENRQQLKLVQQEADRILTQAKLEGEKLRDETVLKAEKKARFIVEQGQQELSQQQGKLESDVRQNMAELLAAAAGKLLHRIVSRDEHHKLIAESLKEAGLKQ